MLVARRQRRTRARAARAPRARHAPATAASAPQCSTGEQTQLRCARWRAAPPSSPAWRRHEAVAGKHATQRARTRDGARASARARARSPCARALPRGGARDAGRRTVVEHRHASAATASKRGRGAGHGGRRRAAVARRALGGRRGARARARRGLSRARARRWSSAARARRPRSATCVGVSDARRLRRRPSRPRRWRRARRCVARRSRHAARGSGGPRRGSHGARNSGAFALSHPERRARRGGICGGARKPPAPAAGACSRCAPCSPDWTVRVRQRRSVPTRRRDVRPASWASPSSAKRSSSRCDPDRATALGGGTQARLPRRRRGWIRFRLLRNSRASQRIDGLCDGGDIARHGARRGVRQPMDVAATHLSAA